MTNPPPLKPGSYYHIYNRGNNRENIFIEERNYSYFLRLWAKHIEPIAETLVYCLMFNHFHALVHIKEGNKGNTKLPSQAFSNLFNAYARTINMTYGRTGALFQRPFGRIEVTSNDYLIHLTIYIHHNPQKHRFVQDFRDWSHSSYQAILSDKATRLARQMLLGIFEGRANFEAAHRDERGIDHVDWIGEDPD